MIRARSTLEAIRRADSILESAPNASAVDQIVARWKRACNTQECWSRMSYSLGDAAASNLAAQAIVIRNHVMAKGKSIRYSLNMVGLH